MKIKHADTKHVGDTALTKISQYIEEPSEETSSAPENLTHFIWMGSRLFDCPHLNNIRQVRKLDKVPVIWSSHFNKADQTKAYKEGFILKPIQTLWSKLETRSLDMKLKAFYDDASGRLPPNYAQASDILRLVILKQYGGLYLDCDVSTDEKHRHLNLSQFNTWQKNHEVIIPNNNNDIIYVKTSHHIFIQQLLKAIVDYGSKEENSFYHFKPFKRLIGFNRFDPKLQHVLCSGGPEIVHQELNRFIEQNGASNVKTFARLNEQTAMSWMKPESKFRHWILKHTSSIKNEPLLWLAKIKTDIQYQFSRKFNPVTKMSIINFAKYELILQYMPRDKQKPYKKLLLKSGLQLLRQKYPTSIESSLIRSCHCIHIDDYLFLADSLGCAFPSLLKLFTPIEWATHQIAAVKYTLLLTNSSLNEPGERVIATAFYLADFQGLFGALMLWVLISILKDAKVMQREQELTV